MHAGSDRAIGEKLLQRFGQIELDEVSGAGDRATTAAAYDTLRDDMETWLSNH